MSFNPFFTYDVTHRPNEIKFLNIAITDPEFSAMSTCAGYTYNVDKKHLEICGDADYINRLLEDDIQDEIFQTLKHHAEELVEHSKLREGELAIYTNVKVEFKTIADKLMDE